ncbi:MAG TPA: D-glycero-beta-D-manno-heptose-7-phosphate kinase [Desulfatiglandales bacterium]|nr:D-glycero-beta-D-manno-heptose-7-phosphate kinase [Desulfatiglandales bacterium]
MTRFSEREFPAMLKEMGFDLDPASLAGSIERFPKTRVLVIGDIIMDEYIWGDVSRISPEAPVPVVDVKRETKMLGGAGNVLNNIRALGGEAILCGVVGDDSTGRQVVKMVKGLGASTEGILQEPDRPTTIKTRVVAQHQQVVRFDRESRRELLRESVERLLGFVSRMRKDIHAIVVSDYAKGVISPRLMKGLRELAADSGIVLGVDPKKNNFEHYKGIDVITPNHHEASAFSGIAITDDETLIRAGKQILRHLKCRSVLITQGKDGMTLFERKGEPVHIATVARKVFDVTGAGDTVISTFCLGLAAGMDLKSAALISNFAAGIVVGEVGTSTVKAEELKRVIYERLGKA